MNLTTLRSSMSLRRWALAGLIGACLTGVFYLYSRPDFLVLVANQVWACF